MMTGWRDCHFTAKGVDFFRGAFYDDQIIRHQRPGVQFWQAEVTRQKLLDAANSAIADWRTELALGDISDDDKASLTKWMVYIKGLKSLDLTDVSDETTFTAIRWPALPQ
ncbi:tail fiber assembly protein [Salmonella enterica subsp. enterica serovar Thompson]|nr:tail fiber assembly protein [Salmonella enterica]EDV6504896.1 tail fiber assembly protein [Salmonella enterica subsp. enterica serovar Thompson]